MCLICRVPSASVPTNQGQQRLEQLQLGAGQLLGGRSGRFDGGQPAARSAGHDQYAVSAVFRADRRPGRLLGRHAPAPALAVALPPDVAQLAGQLGPPERLARPRDAAAQGGHHRAVGDHVAPQQLPISPHSHPPHTLTC